MLTSAMLMQRLERLGYKIALCACEAVPCVNLPNMMCCADSAVPMRVCIQNVLLCNCDTSEGGAAHWTYICIHVSEQRVAKAVRWGIRAHLMKDQLLISREHLAAWATL